MGGILPSGLLQPGSVSDLQSKPPVPLWQTCVALGTAAILPLVCGR